jgi:hypothetical protein
LGPAIFALVAQNRGIVMTRPTSVGSAFALHDAATGRVLATHEMPRPATGTSPAVATAIAYTPDRRRVASLASVGWASADRELKVWDATTEKEVPADCRTASARHARVRPNDVGRIPGLEPDAEVTAWMAPWLLDHAWQSLSSGRSRDCTCDGRLGVRHRWCPTFPSKSVSRRTGDIPPELSAGYASV